jgi:hypothetical protein
MRRRSALLPELAARIKRDGRKEESRLKRTRGFSFILPALNIALAFRTNIAYIVLGSSAVSGQD